MNVTKTDLIGDLVRYINTLEKGGKTVGYMTALLISWRNLDEAQVSAIVTETITSLSSYSAASNSYFLD